MKELSNGLLLGHETILIHSGCLEALVLIASDPELPFFDIPKWGCTQSRKYFKIHGLKVVEKLFVEKEYFPIDVSSER